MPLPAQIDSASVGDPGLHLGMPALEAGLASMPPAPRDAGRVRLLIGRGAGGMRDAPDRAELTRQEGFPGDAWGSGPDRDPEAQLAVMERGVAELIANGQPLGLFGDQLFVDLDLSRENLPTGARIRIGSAVLEVTARPHNGCQKFRARFGADALRFVSRADLRHRNLRGVYMRVVRDGEIRLDDLIEVVRRGPAAAAAPDPRSYAVIWRYQVLPDRVPEFEKCYGPSGTWAKLFARAEGYRGTALLKDESDPLVYVTVDRWESEAAFVAFREKYDQPYRELDSSCDSFTQVETRVGSFTELS